MATASQWDQHNLTDLVRQILRSVAPEPVYSMGRPFLTTYQIAIELERRFPQVVAALNLAMGGSGHGPYALTTYLARWLPDRIVNRGVTDIELRFLAPNHLKTLEFDDHGKSIVATTHQAGFNSTMFRYIGQD